jgi:hypothetical protein
VARRISSIASAPGWKAKVADATETAGFRVITLISWALVEDANGSTEIVGTVQRAGTPEYPHGYLGFADEVDGFQGYTFTGLATRASD